MSNNEDSWPNGNADAHVFAYVSKFVHDSSRFRDL